MSTSLYLYSNHTDATVLYIEALLKNKHIRLVKHKSNSVMMNVNTSEGQFLLSIYTHRVTPFDVSPTLCLEIIKQDVPINGLCVCISEYINHTDNLFVSLVSNEKAPPLGKLFLEKLDQDTGKDILTILAKKMLGDAAVLKEYSPTIQSMTLISTIVEKKKSEMTREEVYSLVDQLFM